MNEATVYDGNAIPIIKIGDICHKCRKPFEAYDKIEWIELQGNKYYVRHKRCYE